MTEESTAALVEDDTQKPAEEQVTEHATDTNTEQSAAQPSEDATAQDKIQQRINKLTWQREEEKRNRKAAEAKTAKLEAELSAAALKEPRLEDFEHDEDKFRSAQIQYEVKKGIQEQTASTVEATQKSDIDRVFDTFEERASALNLPDFYDITAKVPTLPDETRLAIMRQENGPMITYHLGKDEALGAQLAAMNPIDAAILVGQLSSQLGQPQHKPSAAPEPIDPITQTGTLSGEQDDPLIKGASFE